MMAAMDVVAAGGGILVLGDPLATGVGARAAQIGALALTAVSAVVALGDGGREPQAAQEAPGLRGRRDVHEGAAVGRAGARRRRTRAASFPRDGAGLPGVRPADRA
jgi:hypothetical protein